MIDRNTAAVSVFQAGFEATRELEVRPQGRVGTSSCRSAGTAWSGYYIDMIWQKNPRLRRTLRAVFEKCAFSVTQLFHADQQRLFA